MTGDVQWAYVVGAYPTPYKAVETRLQKMGINVAGHCENESRFSVPKAATFLLVISDQCSHNMRYKADDIAKDRGIPIIVGPYKNWVNLEARILSNGLGFKNLELVAGGQEIISPEPRKEFRSTIGEALMAKQRQLAAEHREESPAPKPVEVKKVSGRAELAQKKRDFILAELNLHNHELETYTNAQLREDLEKKNVKASVSLLSDLRRLHKIPQPPRGYKRPRAGKKVEKITMEKGKVVQKVVKGTAEKDFDVIQGFLDEWVLNHHIPHVAILFKDGKWSVGWDEVEVVAKAKEYSKRGS
jgi:hypothetical protein